MEVDVAMVMVTPPDSRGYCSVGIHPDILMTGIDCAKRVIAQVNPRMVRVHGDTFVHVSRFHAIVEHESPLKELLTGTTDQISHDIAGHVAALIENGSTLQLGNVEAMALLQSVGYSLTLDPVSQIYRAVHPFRENGARSREA